MNVLIFTGGLYPSRDAFDAFLHQSDSIDFTIAADSGFDTAMELGFRCDVVIGDMDSIRNIRILKSMQNVEILEHPKDKDFTDTELALLEAKKRGATKILLVGGDGGRLDHTLALLKLLKKNDVPLIWLCKEQIVYVLDEFKCNYKQICVSPEANVSVFMLGKSGCIHSKGLKWELNSLDWEKDEYSVSNRISDDNALNNKPIEFSVIKGSFMLIVPYSTL